MKRPTSTKPASPRPPRRARPNSGITNTFSPRDPSVFSPRAALSLSLAAANSTKPSPLLSSGPAFISDGGEVSAGDARLNHVASPTKEAASIIEAIKLRLEQRSVKEFLGVFKNIDKARTGTLSKTELREGLETLNYPLKTDRAAEAFLQQTMCAFGMDYERDGKVNFLKYFHEFGKAAHPQAAPTDVRSEGERWGDIVAAPKHSPNSPPGAKVKVPAGATDRRNDLAKVRGATNRKFLAKLSNDMGVEARLPTTTPGIRRLFLNLDKDSSGFVSRDTLRDHLAGCNMGWDDAVVDRVTGLCDTNNDGFVQFRDMAHVLTMIRSNIAVEQSRPLCVGQTDTRVGGGTSAPLAMSRMSRSRGYPRSNMSGMSDSSWSPRPGMVATPRAPSSVAASSTCTGGTTDDGSEQPETRSHPLVPPLYVTGQPPVPPRSPRVNTGAFNMGTRRMYMLGEEEPCLGDPGLIPQKSGATYGPSGGVDRGGSGAWQRDASTRPMIEPASDSDGFAGPAQQFAPKGGRKFTDAVKDKRDQLRDTTRVRLGARTARESTILRGKDEARDLAMTGRIDSKRQQQARYFTAVLGGQATSREGRDGKGRPYEGRAPHLIDHLLGAQVVACQVGARTVVSHEVPKVAAHMAKKVLPHRASPSQPIPLAVDPDDRLPGAFGDDPDAVPLFLPRGEAAR